jgi:hypothetical protein
MFRSTRYRVSHGMANLLGSWACTQESNHGRQEFRKSRYIITRTHTHTSLQLLAPRFTQPRQPLVLTHALPFHLQSTSPARSPSSFLDDKLERRSSSSSRSTRVPRTGLTLTPLLPESRSESVKVVLDKSVGSDKVLMEPFAGDAGTP